MTVNATTQPPRLPAHTSQESRGCIKSINMLSKRHPELVSGTHFQWIGVPKQVRNDFTKNF